MLYYLFACRDMFEYLFFVWMNEIIKVSWNTTLFLNSISFTKMYL